MTLYLVGTNGKVRLPVENGKDVEENLEEALVRPQRRRAALLQVTGGCKEKIFYLFLLIFLFKENNCNHFSSKD